MEAEKNVRDTIRTLLAMNNETQKSLAVSIGISLSALSAKQTGRHRWQLNELERVAQHWMLPLVDLLQGAPHAVAALPKAPRQRDRASAA